MNKLKGFKFYIIIALVVLITVAIFLGMHPAEKWYDNYPVVAHALGTSGEEPYNSLEGFNWSYEHGQRVFECDFALTSDGKIVLAHSFDETGQEGIDEEHIPDLATFKGTLLEGKYTPLTYGDMIKIMQEHEDIYLVTDFKCDDSGMSLDQMEKMVSETKAAGATEIFKRFIIQFYDEGELPQIRKMAKFGGYIFTLYKKDFDGSKEAFEDIAKFCHRNRVDVVVMKKGRFSPKLLPVAEKYGIKIFPHTVYTTWQAEQNIESGADGAYCDGVTIKDYKRVSELPAHWYDVGDYFCAVSDNEMLSQNYEEGKRCFYMKQQPASEVLSALEAHSDIRVLIDYNEDMISELSELSGGRHYDERISRLVVRTDKLAIGKSLKPYFFWCDVIYDARSDIDVILAENPDNEQSEMLGLLDDIKEKGIAAMQVSRDKWKEEYDSYAADAGILVIKDEF